MAKRLEACPYCGKAGSEFKNYDSRIAHVKRGCPMLPSKKGERVTALPPSTFVKASPTEGEVKPSQEEEQPEPSQAAQALEEAFDPILRAIMQKVEERITAIETDLGEKLIKATQNIDEQLGKVPEMIEASVAATLRPILKGQAAAIPEEPALAVGQVRQPAGAGGLGNMVTGVLNGINWDGVLNAVIEQYGGGDINKAVAKFLTGGGKAGQKKKEPLNAMFFNRGENTVNSAIRNKKIDPDAFAQTTLAQAEVVMQAPDLDIDTRSLWLGKQAAATNFLASVKLAKETAAKAPEVPSAT